MKSHLQLKVLLGAVLTALCVYAGLYAYTSHRFASAFVGASLGDSPEAVTRRFGVPPIVEFPHSISFDGFTMYPCSSPCDLRFWWQDPSSVFRSQAYYFEFGASRQLIRKTHYDHLDAAYLRWQVRLKQGTKLEQEARLGWSSNDADRLRAAKVAVLVRLLAPPEANPADPSWGPLSKFLVVRSWKGPFQPGDTFTAATTAMCFGLSCRALLIPKETGQLAVLFSLGDAPPIYPIIYAHGGDEAQVEKAAAEIDAIATLGTERANDGTRLRESPAPSSRSQQR